MMQKIVEVKERFRMAATRPTAERLRISIWSTMCASNPSHPAGPEVFRKDCDMVRRYGGMVALLRAAQYGGSQVRRVVCEALRNLLHYPELRLHLLFAGAAHPLAEMLESSSLEDRNNALELLDLLAQRCFAHAHELAERPDLTLMWRDPCRICGARCGKSCQRPEHEAKKYIAFPELLMTMLRFIDDEGAPTRIGAMMFLHKLAAGPAVTTLTAAVTMGLTGQRAGSLRIHVIAGRGLPNMDDYGAMDPYVKTTLLTKHLDPKEAKTKPLLEGGSDPHWERQEHEAVIYLDWYAPENDGERDGDGGNDGGRGESGDSGKTDENESLGAAAQLNAPSNDGEKEKKEEKEEKEEEEEAWQAELAAIEKAVEDAQDDFSVPKLSVKVYDYDYVGEHDEVGYVMIPLDTMFCEPMVKREKWHDLEALKVAMRQGEGPPREHYGRHGEFGQLRFSTVFIPIGAHAAPRPLRAPSEVRDRRRQRAKEARERGAPVLTSDRPRALESLLGNMLSTEPGEATIAFEVLFQMCRLESTRSQLLGSGIVELLQPLLFSGDSHDASLEFTAPEVMEALDDPAVVAKYVTRPIRCDNATAFVRCMFLLVGLSGDPMVRQAEMLDVSASLGAICDQLRWEILGVMNRRGGQSLGAVVAAAAAWCHTSPCAVLDAR